MHLRRSIFQISFASLHSTRAVAEKDMGMAGRSRRRKKGAKGATKEGGQTNVEPGAPAQLATSSVEKKQVCVRSVAHTLQRVTNTPPHALVRRVRSTSLTSLANVLLMLCCSPAPSLSLPPLSLSLVRYSHFYSLGQKDHDPCKICGSEQLLHAMDPQSGRESDISGRSPAYPRSVHNCPGDDRRDRG